MSQILQVFDFDGNVAHPPTEIYGYKDNHLVVLNSQEYNTIKNDPEYTFYPDAFWQFDSDRLLKLQVRGCELGVSFPDLVECVEAKIPFCVLTARGNSPEALYWSVKHLLDREKVEYDEDYLFLNYFIGVSYPLYKITGNISQDKALNLKKLATRGNFDTITFSDDCVSNCQAVEAELSLLDINYTIYHTENEVKNRYKCSNYSAS